MRLQEPPPAPEFSADNEQTTEYLLLNKLGKKFPTLRETLLKLFPVDLRSLALTRIAVGLLVLIDLALRLPDLRVFYSDEGLVPRSTLFQALPRSRYTSLHILSGRSEFEAFLFLIAAGFALMLIVGLKSRLATFASWLLIASLHNRNPFVVHGGDDLLRMLLFWGMFTPWGARYSIESALKEDRKNLPKSLLSIGGAAFLVQVPLLYFFTGLLKNGREWRHDFTAVFYVLKSPDFAQPLAKWMTSFPNDLRVLTASTLVVEILGALLLFSPFFTRVARTIALEAFFLLQLSFLFTLKLGLFPLVSMTALLPFLPAALWDRIFSRGVDEENSLTIYYDGKCEFCRKSVLMISAFCVLPSAHRREAQSNPAINEEMMRFGSWVVIGQDGIHRHGFAALIYLFEESPTLWPLALALRQPPIEFLGERVCKFVARNRGALASRMAWLRVRSVRLKQPLMLSMLCFFSLAYVVIDNMGSVARSPLRIPAKLSFLGRSIRIHQNWKMFAPAPPRAVRWVVVDGERKDGQLVTLFDGRPLSPANPDNSPLLIRSYNWRTYWSWLRLDDQKAWPPVATRYFCNRWNSTHNGEEALSTITIHKVDQPIPLNGPDQEPQVATLLDSECARDSP